ncbi:hypothetical protein Esi_0269_0014 [Ectocarpus siliculosus]|uniref:Uncharacterized protein n=1 Tax=Ectocarpus siliculosus TaxID=2880 RepID=D7FU97_ECTSI|nr:hypothetical protein Esi_0269_0014 [Ectocarpus siliculosus]|eukprot:CBJ31624.1 hypothetical protein Esi_0269_0014 [Ectocarpus siliculosus]
MEISPRRRPKKQHHPTKPVEWHTPSFVKWFDAKSCIVLDVQQTQALFSQGREARKLPAPAVERSKLPYTPSSSTRTPAPVVVRAVKTPAPTIPTKKPSPLAPSPSSTPAAPIRALPPASPRRPTVPLASTGKRQRDGKGLQKPEETRAERMKAAPRRLQNIGPVATTATALTAATITAATITTSTATTATTITITATITATTATTPPATTITASTTATTATATTASTATITAATSCSEKDVETIAAAKKIAEVHCCHQPQHENEGWVRMPYLSDEDGGKEVAGAFVHLPVTILPPTCGQVPAGKGAKCDACHDDRRGCSWTPDGLELLCNYCADAPRRERKRQGDRAAPSFHLSSMPAPQVVVFGK